MRVRADDGAGVAACRLHTALFTAHSSSHLASEIVMVLLSLVHLHLRGFLWEADKHAVAASVNELLPDMTV